MVFRRVYRWSRGNPRLGARNAFRCIQPGSMLGKNDRMRQSASLKVMNIRWIDSLGLDQDKESDRSSTAGLRHRPDLSSDVSLRLRDSISTTIINICMRSIIRRNCTGRVTVHLYLYFSLRSTPAPRVLQRSKVSVEAPYVCRFCHNKHLRSPPRQSIFNGPPDAQLMTSNSSTLSSQ